MISKKISMLGMWGVGKTSLVQRFVSSIYDEKYLATMGVKVDKKEVNVDGQDLNMMLWDIAGAENHFDVPAHYVKGSAGYLLVMDGTRPESITAGLDLVQMVNENVGEIPFVAVVNKADLDWPLSDDEISAQLAAHGGTFLKSSAKTGENVEQAFLNLAKLVLGSE